MLSLICHCLTTRHRRSSIEVASYQPPQRPPCRHYLLNANSNKSTTNPPITQTLIKDGDWICPSCYMLNLTTRTACYHCKKVYTSILKRIRVTEIIPKIIRILPMDLIPPNASPGIKLVLAFFHTPPQTKQSLQTGDWICPICAVINFRFRSACFKCTRVHSGRRICLLPFKFDTCSLSSTSLFKILADLQGLNVSSSSFKSKVWVCRACLLINLNECFTCRQCYLPYTFPT